FRFNTSVTQARWDDERRHYAITLDTGESADFDVIVCAVGFLSEPKFPDWPGLESFTGPTFHTLYWAHHLDPPGKNVALAGTRATATQIVPAIADKVGHLTLFQREPGWILRKNDHDYSPEELAKYAKPMARRIRRLKLFVNFQRSYHGGAIHHTGSKK